MDRSTVASLYRGISVAGVECCRQANVNEASHQLQPPHQRGGGKTGGHTRRLRTAYTNTQVCPSHGNYSYALLFAGYEKISCNSVQRDSVASD